MKKTRIIPKNIRFFAAKAIFFLIALPFEFANAEISQVPLEEQPVESHGIIVKFDETRVDVPESGVLPDSVLEDKHDVEIIESLPEQNIVIVTPTSDIASEIAELNADPNVEYAEPNYNREISVIPTNDAYRSYLWGLDNEGQSLLDTDLNPITGTADADIDLPEAWSLSQGSSTVTVAVIDTGVLYTHPDLIDQMWDGTNCKDENGAALGGCLYGYDFENGDNNPLPEHYHGTHVAGTIAAKSNNGIGILGITPHARIMALRFGLDVASEVRAIDFAIQNGAKIINASYAGSGYSQAEYDAIRRFQDAGGIFIAAAANDSSNNDSSPRYPANYDLPAIISVASTDQNDALSSFSNYGVSSVDVGAPGSNILSTYVTFPGGVPTSAYAVANGTSMAAPHVAGLAALLWSYNPSLTYSQIRDILVNKGDSVAALSGKTVSGKRINAHKALSLFAPRIGAASNDSLPSWALSSDAGDPYTVTIGFKIVDGMAGLSATLGNFEYSTTSGASWSEVPAGNMIGATNTFSTALDYSGATSSLSIDTGSLSAPSIRFRFKAYDGATTSPYVYTEDFVVDTEPPTAVLSNLPALSDTSAIPALSATVGGAGVTAYKYSLDGGAWSNETSVSAAIASSSLRNGAHTLSVIGKDSAGNWQSTASSTGYSWSVTDTTAPAISGLSDDLSAQRTKTWSWSSSDPSAQFRFVISQSATSSLDSISWTSSATTAQSEGDGAYYLVIQARDINGNVSATSSFAVLLDNTAPTATIGGTAVTTSSSAGFSISGDGVTHYKYSLDSGSYSGETAVSTPLSLSSLSNGAHTLSVIGRDNAGNWQSTGSAATYSWTTDVPAPPAPTPAPSSGGGGGGGGAPIVQTPVQNTPVASTTSVALTPSTKKGGDANGDSKVDVLDFNTLMINWGKSGVSAGDLSGDLAVGILDFNLLMINWTIHA